MTCVNIDHTFSVWICFNTINLWHFHSVLNYLCINHTFSVWTFFLQYQYLTRSQCLRLCVNIDHTFSVWICFNTINLWHFHSVLNCLCINHTFSVWISFLQYQYLTLSQCLRLSVNIGHTFSVWICFNTINIWHFLSVNIFTNNMSWLDGW